MKFRVLTEKGDKVRPDVQDLPLSVVPQQDRARV